jgi:predicted nucleic acid-binding protein
LTGLEEPATVDTNIVVYALSTDDKADRAGRLLRGSVFLSVQVLNEYANIALRKRRDPWDVVAADLAALRDAVPRILPIDEDANRSALRIGGRYRLSFYDSLMLAVALAGDARTFYSEDMQHGLVIEGTLRIVDPFR